MNREEIKRMYQNSDAEMTETARVIHGLMVDDLAKFTAFDSTITELYAALFLTAIDNADTVIADSAVIDMQVQKTTAIQVDMDKAVGKYADVKYFAQKAFPTSIATQNEFGINDYERARKSPTQMIQFLDEMHRACAKYQTQLVAKGFSAAAIEEIQTIRNELRTTNTDQEVFKRQRTKLTADRITVLNNCYAYITEANAAAQRVYKDDFAKRNQFVYSTAPADTTVDFDGEVAASSTVTAGTVPFAIDTVFTFKNAGLVPLVFCLSSTTAFEGIEVAIGGGASVTKTGSELNPNATNILVKNTGDTIGIYEIEVD